MLHAQEVYGENFIRIVLYSYSCQYHPFPVTMHRREPIQRSRESIESRETFIASSRIMTKYQYLQLLFRPRPVGQGLIANACSRAIYLEHASARHAMLGELPSSIIDRLVSASCRFISPLSRGLSIYKESDTGARACK